MNLTKKYQPNTIDKLVGQNHLKDKMREYLEIDVKNIPNLYMIGTNGVGKSSFANMIVEKCGRENLLKLNASDERGIEAIRKKVVPVSHHAAYNGRRVIWFEEAGKLTDVAQEALKDVIEENQHVLWIFTSNTPISKGLRDRCAELHFVPISDEDIRRNVLSIAKIEFGEGKFTSEAIDNIVLYSEGSMRKAINLLESPPTLNASKQLFTTACQDFEKSVAMYQKSMMDTLSFLKEISLLVAETDKIKNVKFKKTVCIEAANHAFMIATGVPSDVVMRSYLAVINTEWSKR